MISVKSKVKAYRDFCFHYVKYPDEILKSDNQKFGFGVTTFLLIILFLGVANYKIKPTDVGFITSIGEAFLFVGMNILLAAASLYLISTLFGPPLEGKLVVSIYGTYLLPVMLMTVMAALLSILNLFSIVVVLLTISFLYAVLFLPIYILIRLLVQQSNNLMPIYSYMSYLVLFHSFFFLYMNIVLNANMTKLISWLTQF